MIDGAYAAVSGLEDHHRAHIPGSGLADLTGDLCDGTSPLRFAVPTPERFAAAMRGLGVGIPVGWCSIQNGPIDANPLLTGG